MKKTFIHDDFLLETKAARTLYHEYAEPLPIIDYHCHLPPADIAEDRRWENIAQVWLSGDHYKWRAMRSNGVPERFCTGDATDREKFDKFAETMPYLVRNPMYHWSHLELARYFGVFDILSPATADRIWNQTRLRLAACDMSARGLMLQSNVRLVCTTDDPCDDLAFHKAVAADGFPVQVLPAWRPDKGMQVERDTWNAWVDRLGKAADMDISSFAKFLDALRLRHAFFADAGCRLSDYGLDYVVSEPCTETKARAIFRKARDGKPVSAEEGVLFRSFMLRFFGRMDAESNWTWQLHFNAMRNNNLRLFPSLGPDTGFDSIGDEPVARPLSRLLGELDREDRLPRTILYSLNPRDNEVLGSMLGNFQRDPVPGKIQLGSGWWFNDQMDGMKRQLEALSQLGLVSRFVGMLTDSRSFLSYTRHEYFRRILCNLFGDDIERGLLPNDIPWIGEVVRGICYNNAVRYFGFNLQEA